MCRTDFSACSSDASAFRFRKVGKTRKTENTVQVDDLENVTIGEVYIEPEGRNLFLVATIPREQVDKMLKAIQGNSKPR